MGDIGASLMDALQIPHATVPRHNFALSCLAVYPHREIRMTVISHECAYISPFQILRLCSMTDAGVRKDEDVVAQKFAHLARFVIATFVDPRPQTLDITCGIQVK
jgi:hypothetical protein